MFTQGTLWNWPVGSLVLLRFFLSFLPGTGQLRSQLLVENKLTVTSAFI